MSTPDRFIDFIECPLGSVLRVSASEIEVGLPKLIGINLLLTLEHTHLHRVMAFSCSDT